MRSKFKSSHSCRHCGLRKFPSLNHVPKNYLQESNPSSSRDIFSVACHKMSFIETENDIVNDLDLDLESMRNGSKKSRNNDGSSSITSTAVRANIFVAEHKVSRQQRGLALDYEGKFRGCIVWFTGLSGAGKSTVAMGVEKQLVSRGV